MILAAMNRWNEQRHEGQWIPHDEWAIGLALAGRGWGKTRFGSEWSWQRAATAPVNLKRAYRHLVSAPTNADLLGVCFEGDSGLIACIPPSLIQHYVKTPRPMVTLFNGAKLIGIAAEQPSRFRGPQFHSAWLDEVAAWGDNGKDPQEAWDMISFSVRLGTDTRILVTTTPRPIPLIKDLVKRPDTVVIGGSTHQNLANLSAEFKKRIMSYEGTKIGRQEIYAEILENDGGIIKRSDLRLWPHGKPFPVFEYIVMSLDTSYSEESRDKKKNTTDPSACSVWGCFKYFPERPMLDAKGRPRSLFGIMLLDCWEERLGFPELVDKVKRERKSLYGADDAKPIIAPLRGPSQAEGTGKGIDLIVIEEKASGKSLRQQLFKDGILTRPYNPGKADKLTRLHIVSPLAASGILWVPEGKSSGKPMTWANGLIDQLCTFSGEGTIVHDDLLDTATQALRVIDDTWLHYLREAQKLPLPGEDLIDTTKKPRQNPYAV